MTALRDDDTRRRIAEDLGSTLFVDAGAGSGKTKSLVNRVRQLVLVDAVPLRLIAAVTFTEKAAAELRDRLRAEFEAMVARADADEEARRRATQALDDLDSAAIGTLHSFARRILMAHPVQAGLPPLVEVADEVASQVAFEQRWRLLLEDLLIDPGVQDALVMALDMGVRTEHLRALARSFDADWDLIEPRVLVGPTPSVPVLDLAPFLLRARIVCDRASECTDPSDKFLERLAALADWAGEHTGAQSSDEAIVALTELAGLSTAHGRKPHWPDLEGVRGDFRTLKDDALDALTEVRHRVLLILARRLGQACLDGAEQRRSEGRLDFHDLLVLSRDLVRSPEHGAEVRAALHERYQRLLLDEFQDTDPIQIELAVRIAGGRDADAERWQDVVVPEGRLFVVGDPKQSIYRFRRADIAVYLQARSAVGRTENLTTNFRTVEPLLDWVNHVFGRLIIEEPAMQPEFVALDHDRDSHPSGHHVVMLGTDAHPDSARAADVREAEAADVAAAVCTAITEKWQVLDERTEQWRDVRLDDIAVLVPTRTSLPWLEAALDDAGVPFRAEASSLVYRTEEVRDVLMAARAIDDPSDALALVATLRSSLFGCGDDDLFTWKRDGGSFNLRGPLPGTVAADHPVSEAVAYLQTLERRRAWMTPSEVLDTLVRDRRMLEVAWGGQRARDVWRRLRFVVDQARAWSEAGPGSLRSYLAWAHRQGDDSARVHEAVLPETDLDAVRVLTIHAAKGLEFPVVIVSGMSTRPGGAQQSVEVLYEPAFAVKMSKDVQTRDFAEAKPIDEQMGHYERLRLLYVACTRARDHLVVSLHRAARKKEPETDASRTNAELLALGCDGSHHELLAPSEVALSAPTRTTPTQPPAYDAWRAALDERLGRAATPSAISASSLEGADRHAVDDPDSSAETVVTVDPGLQKGPRNLELPPWNKGRYGTAVGRAVHGTLQTVDLVTSDGLEQVVAAQCLAEGVSSYAEVVELLCRQALASDVVRRAATRPHWRETYVGTTQEDGTVLEGFIDLVFREDDGALVVVDYKTDAVPAAAVPARVAFYRGQMEAYVTALSRATGAAGVRGVLLFLNPEAAFEAPVI
jgi:ATP-dependent exoDNAse (exonuclease V) beta subunit